MAGYSDLFSLVAVHVLELRSIGEYRRLYDISSCVTGGTEFALNNEGESV